MNIVVTLTDSVQITEDAWRVKRISNTFDTQCSLDEIMEWADKHSKRCDLSMLSFTEVVE
jgi:hypothetical protein